MSDSEDEESRGGKKCDGCRKKMTDGWCEPCATKLTDVSLPLSTRLTSAGFGFHLKTTDGRAGLLRFEVEGRGRKRGLMVELYIHYPEEKTPESLLLNDWVHRWTGGIGILKQDTKAAKEHENKKAKVVQQTKIQLSLKRHPPHLKEQDEMLTVELSPEGLLQGQFIRPAYRSLLASGGKLPRERLDSYHFTGYPICLGYSQRKISDDVWRDTYRGKDVEARTDTFHNKQEVEEAEKKRAKDEEEARNALRKKVGLPFEFEAKYDYRTDTTRADYEPSGFNSGDEKGYLRDYLGEDDMDELEGADWSGRPGFRCRLCGRRSDNVGPRRGFCYRTSYCGGCTDLPEMKEEETEIRNKEFSLIEM